MTDFFKPKSRNLRCTRWAVLLMAISLLAACNANRENDATTGDEQLYIVTTTGMIEDAVLHITGNRAKVEALMGPGVDPHLYTQGDLRKLSAADVIFYNGLHLEGKMGEVLEKLGHQKPVIAVAEAIPESRLLLAPGSMDAFDPHVWFDVSLWQLVVSAVGSHLQELDASNGDFYAANTQHYRQTLDTLHRFVRQSIQSIPAAQRVLITAHDAFEYFGKAYGIEVKGLQGISTVSDFGLKDITGLVDFIGQHRIKAVFVESSVPKRAIEAVVEGCHNKGHEVQIGGTLFSDAMGPEGTFEGTYVGMVTTNVNTIVAALK